MSGWYQDGLTLDLNTLTDPGAVGVLLLDPFYVFAADDTMAEIVVNEVSGGSYDRVTLDGLVVDETVATQVRLLYPGTLEIGRPADTLGWLIIYRTSDDSLILATEVTGDDGISTPVEFSWLDDVVGIRNASPSEIEPGQGIPPGGLAGQVLAKASDDDYDVEWIDPPEGTGGGGSALLPPLPLVDPGRVDLLADHANQGLLPFAGDSIWLIVTHGELDAAPDGTRWHLMNPLPAAFGFEFGVFPHEEDVDIEVTSLNGYRGVAPDGGRAELWKANSTAYLLSGDLVPMDPPPPIEEPPPGDEPMMFFRMMADDFLRADAPTLGAPDDGIPVAYEYDGDGTWEVSDNTAALTGGSAGAQTVYCDTAGFGTLTFVTGAGDVGSTSTLSVICGNVYYDLGARTDGYLLLNEAGEFWYSESGEPPTLQYTLTGFPGFVEGETVTIERVYVGPYVDGFRVTVGALFEQHVTDYPSSPPSFGDYIGFRVDFVPGDLPKRIDFWEVTQPATSLDVPKSFAGTSVHDITGGMWTGPPVEATTYNGSWEWVSGSDYYPDGSPGYDSHYRASEITDGALKYTRIQADVASADQFVAGAFRTDLTRRETEPITEIIEGNGFVFRGSATEFLALQFSNGLSGMQATLHAVTDSGATETLLHTFGLEIRDALDTIVPSTGWTAVRAFIGADDVFWLQANGVTEAVDLSAATLPTGTDAGVLFRRDVSGTIPTMSLGTGWYTTVLHALI